VDCSYRVYFIHSKCYIQLAIFIISGSLLGKKKVKNSPVLTISRKCEKLHLRFPWKAVLPRNKLKLCFPKLPVWINPSNIQQLVNCASKSSRNLIDEIQTKTLKVFLALKNSKIKKKNVDWEIKKQINTQVKLHFEKTNSNNKIFSQKSHFNWQRHLSRQLHVQLRPCIQFCWNLISSPIENYWFQFPSSQSIVIVELAFRFLPTAIFGTYYLFRWSVHRKRYQF